MIKFDEKSEEIKEILDKLKDNDWYEELDLTGTKWIELRQEETNQLLDYITNLQEENERLKKKKLSNDLAEAILFNQKRCEQNKELKQRIYKVIEYIERLKQPYKERYGRNLIVKDLDKLIEILNNVDR